MGHLAITNNSSCITKRKEIVEIFVVGILGLSMFILILYPYFNYFLFGHEIKPGFHFSSPIDRLEIDSDLAPALTEVKYLYEYTDSESDKKAIFSLGTGLVIGPRHLIIPSAVFRRLEIPSNTTYQYFIDGTPASLVEELSDDTLAILKLDSSENQIFFTRYLNPELITKQAIKMVNNGQTLCFKNKDDGFETEFITFAPLQRLPTERFFHPLMQTQVDVDYLRDRQINGVVVSGDWTFYKDRCTLQVLGLAFGRLQPNSTDDTNHSFQKMTLELIPGWEILEFLAKVKKSGIKLN